MRHRIRWIVASIMLLLLLAFIMLFERVDRTPYTEQAYYQQAQQMVDSAFSHYQPAVGDSLQVGWSQQNITPSEPAHLMGYGWKGDYKQVHDSLWVRTMVFHLGSITVGIVSYDLMLTPPAVVRQVRQALDSLPIDHVYFTAIHTHKGYGGWVDGLGRELIAGKYDPALVQYLTQQTVTSLKQAYQNVLPAQVAYHQFAMDSLVNNRLVKDGEIEPYLRALYVRRSDGSQGVLCSYTAHATYVTSKSTDLSADYPGALVQQLETDTAIDFAMFAAGAVGSHSPHKPGPFSYKKLEAYASQLATPIRQALPTLSYDSIHQLGFAEVPFTTGEAQLRITENWRLRPYWFQKAMGNMHPSLTYLQLSDILLVGTPGDFSGLLYDQIQSDGTPLMITSFNGEYLGYLIPSQYYGINHRETRITNWFGPYTGDFTVDLINQGLHHIAPSTAATTD
uniref:Neutral/alkaline non-lysosomal ceramidase N-terminal domain-containing protein n=1 Tax=Roseihalotalea indica TaxID=2867963 RepID=A0AA49JB25_9BACT|nr:neutral/alkaline non-lysosomal ceramidase N-terminal domain-containing protein [Tunicatimonas sp. TK19036]